MNCGKKIKQTCGITVYAPCVQYELDIPEFSSLSSESCVDIEQTTKDLYEHVSVIKNDLDLSELGNNCITYIPSAKVKDVILKYEEEICLLKEKVEVLETRPICDMPITNCNLDLSGITDICDNPVNTFGELLQYFITQLNP